jgi:hypothetical protein
LQQKTLLVMGYLPLTLHMPIVVHAVSTRLFPRLPLAPSFFTLAFLDMIWVHVIQVLGMLGVLGVCNMLQDPWHMLPDLRIHNMGGYGCKT